MEAIDFKKPQKNLSINGFPITFRKTRLSCGAPVWVPRGISRNNDAECWRILLMHEKGEFSDYEFDHGEPLKSLARAYERLLDEIQNAVSRFSVDSRKRPPGAGRDPLIDTGFTGVSISRSIRENKKRVVVTSHQMTRNFSGKAVAKGHYMGSISEEALIEDPASEEKRFFELLKKAVAIRRFYNKQRSLGIYEKMTYLYDQVPDDIKEQPVELPNLDIQAIMDSFLVIPGPITPRTTGGDPDALVNRLKTIDLTSPQDPFYLKGRYIRFHKNLVEGRKLWIPRPLFRVNDHWRIKLCHNDGWFCDSVFDADYGDCLMSSLQKAWEYLLSLYLTYEPRKEGAKKALSEPWLCTGIPDTFIQPHRRVSKKTGRARWTFAIYVTQKIDSKKSRNMSIGTWSLDSLSDKTFHEALRKAAAMKAYQAYQIDQGLPFAEAFVSRDAEVPEQFWSSELECPVYSEDLRFFAQIKEQGDTRG